MVVRIQQRFKVALTSARRPTALIVALCLATLGVLLSSTTAEATTTVNDYKYANSAMDQADEWNFYTRECTSFAAWRVNNDLHVPFNNFYGGVHWGDAWMWANAARSAGIPVDSVPIAGSVAVFPVNTDGAGPFGHVAWVIGYSDNSNGKFIDIEDYNWAGTGHYARHTVSITGLSFIHFGKTGAAGGFETWTNPHTNMVMDLTAASATDGTRIQIWTYGNVSQQWWVRTSWPNGYFKISSRATGKCVDIVGPSTADGAAVHEWDCYNTDSQLWSWVAKGTTFNGYPVFQIRNKYSGKCLDITDFGTTVGTKLQQWSCGGGWNQEWA